MGENEPIWKSSVRSALGSEAQEAWIEELSSAFPTALAGGADYLGK